MRTLLKRLMTGSTPDTSTWTTEQWRAHLLDKATSPSERSEIEAMFARSM